VLDNIMGTPPAAPPPGVEGFKENKDGEKALTVREIMQVHRANPTCNSCHGVMDPLGFSLENFDAVGLARRVLWAAPRRRSLLRRAMMCERCRARRKATPLSARSARRRCAAIWRA
jgi:hypothetical protein